jgi:hypothetical protein
MTVFRRRSRIVSFRVSEDEFEMLKEVSRIRGAHSLSDYARYVTCRDLEGEASAAVVCPHLELLNGRVNQLTQDLALLRRLVSE